MKNTFLFFALLFVLQNTSAQEKKIKTFFEGSFKPTFAINENWTLDPDDDETFLNLTGAFVRFGVGYQFGKRFLVSLNAGYDHHIPFAINAFPTYAKLRYNVWTDSERAFFVQVSNGKMWRPSSRFTDGNYFNAGFGYEFESDSRWKPILTFTYHKKQVDGFESSGRLESIAIGIGFRFF